MISRDIAVLDVHPEHWVNLLRGPIAGDAAHMKNHSLLVLVHQSERVLHAVLGGVPRPDLVGYRVDKLSDLRRKLGASVAICLERDFLHRALARADSRLAYHMDYAEQLLHCVAAFREERGVGIRTDPPTPPGPLPPFALLQFLFDRLWPNETSVALYVVDEVKREVFTSLILRKRRGSVDLLTTDLHLGGEGLCASNWKADRLRLLERLATRVAPPYLACFANLCAWRCLCGNPIGSGTLQHLRRAGDLVIEPFPHRLAIVGRVVQWMLNAVQFLRSR